MSRIYDALKRAEQEVKPAAKKPSEDFDSGGDLYQPAKMSAEPVVPPSPAVMPASLESEDTTPEPAPAKSNPVETTKAPKRAVLDSCPVSRWTPSAKMILFADRQRGSSVGAEQFRRLRSRMYQLRDKHVLKRVLVSSAVAGEGKSFVCANLAQALARHSRTRVLLIDADLRKPSLHLELGATATPGLSDYLQGDLDELAVMQRGQLENLFFIGGGTTSANPAELASSAKFKKLMERASELFDWVIVDSSPVVPISDATVLARHCDGVLLVVRAETTPFDLAQKAKEEFRNSVVLGVVLNQVTEMSSYSPYYYNTYKGPATSSEPAETTA
jgi:capsular exopolysaccharide synthesis family protein